MSKELIHQVFDYSEVDLDDKGKLINLEGQIAKSKRRAVEEVLKFGRICLEAQAILAKYGTGSFGKWIEAQGVSRKTGYRSIDSLDAFGVCDNLSQMEVSAMYALAKNEAAKKKALKLAAKGIKISHSVAQQLIEDCQPKLETIEHDDSGEDGRTDSDGTERYPDFVGIAKGYGCGAESAGEDIGAENDEWDDVDESIPAQKPPAKVGEKCPNCLGTKWRDGACVKCSQPEGEPAGEVDEDRIGIQRSKTRKTIEALMRAFDDLQMLSPNTLHKGAIDQCKGLMEDLEVWK